MGNLFCKQTSTPATSDLSKAINPTGTNFLQQQLDKWVVLNEDMDSLAKAYMSYSASYPNLDDDIDKREWTLRIKEGKYAIGSNNNSPSILEPDKYANFGLQSPFPIIIGHHQSTPNTNSKCLIWTTPK